MRVVQESASLKNIGQGYPRNWLQQQKTRIKSISRKFQNNPIKILNHVKPPHQKKKKNIAGRIPETTQKRKIAHTFDYTTEQLL